MAIHGVSHAHSGGSSIAVCSTAPSRKAGLSLAMAVKRYARVNCTCASHTGHQSTSRSGRPSRSHRSRQARVAVDDRQQQQHQRQEVHVVGPEILIHEVQADRHRTQHARGEPCAIPKGQRGGRDHPEDGHAAITSGSVSRRGAQSIQSRGHYGRIVAEPVQVPTRLEAARKAASPTPMRNSPTARAGRRAMSSRVSVPGMTPRSNAPERGNRRSTLRAPCQASQRYGGTKRA